MSKRDKLVEKILRGDRNLKWSEVDALLKWLMYEPDEGETGSHITYINRYIQKSEDFGEEYNEVIMITIVKPHKGKPFSKKTIETLEMVCEILYNKIKLRRDENENE